jgi:hypothetical protein
MHQPGLTGRERRALSLPRHPDEDGRMALEWEQVIVDADDPAGLGGWWATALDWVVVDDDPEEYEIRPAPDRLPGLLFVRVPEPKTLKNRLHLDFRPDDRDAEVTRLLDLGATRADIGQGDETWVVLRDPEDNEFCVLQARPV